MSQRILAVMGAALLPVIFQPAASADTNTQASIPLASLSLVTEPSGLVDAEVTIAGHPETLRLDTGNVMNAMTEPVASDLKLPQDAPFREMVFFGGLLGTRVKEFAIADSLRFNQLDGPGTRFAIVPDKYFPYSVAGVLGSGYLRNYDVEFDFPMASRICSAIRLRH